MFLLKFFPFLFKKLLEEFKNFEFFQNKNKKLKSKKFKKKIFYSLKLKKW